MVVVNDHKKQTFCLFLNGFDSFLERLVEKDMPGDFFNELARLYTISAWSFSHSTNRILPKKVLQLRLFSVTVL